MAVSNRREITTKDPGDRKEGILPLIPHVAPIWPLDKRIEKVRARKASFWKLVRNKMIVLNFLQSLSPTMTDLFLQITNEEEHASNIVTLTRNFEEEQRKKFQRLHEIQSDAFFRAENKKSEWDKLRDREWRTTTLPDVNSTGISMLLTRKSEKLAGTNGAAGKTRCQSDRLTEDASNSKHPEQRKHKAQSFRTLKERFSFQERNEEIYSPGIWQNSKRAEGPIHDPRFQRLLKALVPPSNQAQNGFTKITNTNHDKVSREKENALSARLGRKSPNEKLGETRVVKSSEKNVPKPVRTRNKFARPVGGLWPDEINALIKVAKSYRRTPTIHGCLNENGESIIPTGNGRGPVQL